MNVPVDYALLCRQMEALAEGVPYECANLANGAALLLQAMPDVNWAGFYKLEPEGLVLGPFQGRPACVRIPVGRGVCGTAVQEDRTLVVEDVHAFPGHIACDSTSASEMVIPIHKNGRVWGVLDLDSPHRSRFAPQDRVGLEEFCRILEGIL